jgi:hypothetical protein
MSEPDAACRAIKEEEEEMLLHICLQQAIFQRLPARIYP